MTDKKKRGDDPLFKGMPSHVKSLWDEHQKHKRAKQRAEFIARQQSGK